jgi:hypothetical protein
MEWLSSRKIQVRCLQWRQSNNQRLLDQHRLCASNTILTEFGQATYNRLREGGSAQAEAIFWIANQDTFFSFPLAGDTSTRKAFRQRYAMAVLFYSTGGPKSWIDTFDFLSSSHECDWSRGGNLGGISCLGDSVIGVTIPQNGLSGSIPEEIWALEDLQVLDLNRNSISGPIPDDLHRLSGLGSLSLAFNGISGSLSSSIKNLQGLETLWIEESSIGGTIPPEITKIS